MKAETRCECFKAPPLFICGAADLNSTVGTARASAEGFEIQLAEGFKIQLSRGFKIQLSRGV